MEQVYFEAEFDDDLEPLQAQPPAPKPPKRVFPGDPLLKSAENSLFVSQAGSTILQISLITDNVTRQFAYLQKMQSIKDLIEDDTPSRGPDYEFENQNLSMKSASSNSIGVMVYCMHMMTLNARLPGLIPHIEELLHDPMYGD
jgi:hypothetical protein